MTRVTTDIREAVQHTLTPNPYSYDGALERLEEMIKKQATYLEELTITLYGRTLKRDQLEELLSTHDLRLELDR